MLKRVFKSHVSRLTSHFFLMILAFPVFYACGKKVETVSPLEITGKTECAIDGMSLAEYGGPKAQIHYRGEKEPTFHCETKELFHVYLEPGREAEITAIYVQDSAAIDWKKPVDSWIDAKTAFYVVGSRLEGAMGPTFAPFKTRDAAIPFVKNYGGAVMTFDQLVDKMRKELSK